MAIANVLRVNIFGTLPGGEVWSINPVWQLGGVSTSEDLTPAQVQTIANDIAAVTVPSGMMSLMSSSTTLTGCRVEARRWNGLLAAQAEAAKASPQAGTGLGGNTFQTSAVASLRTSGFGASARGRLYIPATGIVVQPSTLRPTQANIDTALGGVKVYLDLVTTAIELTAVNDVHLSVWSRTNESTLPVNQINMGNVLDVQRRRRDQLIESFSSLPFS